ncbi:proteinase inhibitor I4, serpin [Chitinispirillum alkaliphilum]|nr:proteinase inhibitor I4, serpin [Chitinispirillum alkaliphilum]
MKSISLHFTLLLTTLLTVVCSLNAHQTETENSVEKLSKGNTSFAVDLYHKLRTAEGNIFFSPYSISSVMGMVYGGSHGNTEEEIRRVLNFSQDQNSLHASFKKLNKKLIRTASEQDQVLRIANGLCLTGENELSEDFKDLLKRYYDAEVFDGDLEKINSWVNHKTEGKIEQILESLNPYSVAVLLNAIYFNGTWDEEFDTDKTHDAPFYVSPERQSNASLMYRKGHYRYLGSDRFKVVSIPYKGEAVSMVVLLPTEKYGLEELEEQFTPKTLSFILSELDSQIPQEIELYFPKFDLETEYNLKSVFQKLGISDAFRYGEADFSGMGWPKGELWISQIKHNAAIDVNEEGTEAAAATAVEFRTVSIRNYPQFRADHPFLFLIRDNQTGSILFMGRVTDPVR